MLPFKATYCIDTRVWQWRIQMTRAALPLVLSKNQSIAKHTKPVAIQVWGKNIECVSHHLNRKKQPFIKHSTLPLAANKCFLRSQQ